MLPFVRASAARHKESARAPQGTKYFVYYSRQLLSSGWIDSRLDRRAAVSYEANCAVSTVIKMEKNPVYEILEKYPKINERLRTTLIFGLWPFGFGLRNSRTSRRRVA